MKHWLVAWITCTLLGFMIGVGTFLCFKYEPEVIYVPQLYPEPYPVIQGKVVIEVVKETIEVPICPRPFSSSEELERWLDSKTVFLVLSNKCGDWAMVFQDSAIKDGYLVSVDVIGGREYYNLGFSKDITISSTTRHAINSTVIDRDVYYIEPQTLEVKLVYRME